MIVMKHYNYKIIDVKHIKADDMGHVSIWCHRFNKLITLPYPEFSSDCIVLLANPIDVYISSGYEYVGKYSIQENSRTTCFIYPYFKDKLEYWKRVYEDMDDWNPFFPEQKEIIYVENGMGAHFYKHISFNKDWQPVSHKFYVERILTEDPDNYYQEINRYEEIQIEDYEYNNKENDIDEDSYEFDFTDDFESRNFNITDEKEEYNDMTSGYEVYAVEYFGDVEENECLDECWACYRILEKEWLYLIKVSTQIDGHHFNDYIKEVLGDSLDDALDQMFYYIANTEKRNLYPSDIASCCVYHNGKQIMHEGVSK